MSEKAMWVQLVAAAVSAGRAEEYARGEADRHLAEARRRFDGTEPLPEDDGDRVLGPVFRKWDDAKLCAFIASEMAGNEGDAGLVVAYKILAQRVLDYVKRRRAAPQKAGG